MSENIAPKHFIHQIIKEDVERGLHGGRVHTRFPPEPNGYLHIGHAKSICLNFGMAREFGGKCNLRFDDTNPEKESTEYVESIKEDVRWLGFEWDRECYASDYFQQLYEWALQLIREGKAYVCDLSPEEIRAYRGTLTEPGKPSPYRDRTPEENLELFERMRRGEFKEGEKSLRAKIDMAHPNMTMRDPVIYRIKHVSHHRTGNQWCIYPSYDFAHGQSDSIEGITHSICTLEFAEHRPLYDWFIEQLRIFPSKQYEFARLNLTYTVMSKRKLHQLVQEKYVDGWDDPRMPTLCGLRRRGYTPESIRNFCERIGVTRYNGFTDIGLLEFSIREHLNRIAPRRMAVLNPLKVVLTNYPEDADEAMEAVNNPEDPDAGIRQIPFSRVIYIERDDFLEDAPKKFFRLAPGREVRLRYSYIIRCDEVIRDANGEVVELRCSVDMDTLNKNPEDRKVKGVIHWVAEKGAISGEVRLYDRLFTVERPDADKEKSFLEFLNPDSLKVVQALMEPSLGELRPGESVQFERLGYFCLDKSSTPGKPVFNRTVTLKDTWAKIAAKEE